MKYKNGLIFICLIICLFSIASVCASDVNNTAISTEDNSQMGSTVIDNSLETGIDESQRNEVIIGGSDNETFAELQKKISDAPDIENTTQVNPNNPIRGSESKINTKIVADNITTFPREGNIYFKLTDEDGNPLEGFNVTLDVEFIHRNIMTNSTGEGYFSMNGVGANLDVGNYTGLIKFKGNDDYNPSNLFIDIKIYKLDTTIICDNLTFTYNEFGILMACLKDSEGNPIENGTLELLINKEYESLITNSRGEVGFNLTSFSVGTYYGNLYFDGTNRYVGSTIPVRVTVKGIPTVINVSDINGTVGHEVTLTANVTSSNNFKINEGVVIFFDTNINIGQANVNDGIATLTYTPTTDGEHNITAVFNSNNYLTSNNTAKLMVDSAAIEVLVDDGTVGFNNTFFVNVKGLYSIINEGCISLYVDNEFVDKVDVIKGSAILYYVPLLAKKYMVKMIFSDSVNFLTSENTTVFTVKKADSQVIINDIECKVSHNVTLTAFVTSSNNLTINEGKISFFDGEVSIGEGNVNNGVASLIFTPDLVGNHTITAIFNSDDYLSSNDSAKLLVGGTVKANDMIVPYGNGYDFIATFSKVDGTSLADSYVIFSVNGKDYVVKTDSNGIAILAIGLGNGVYNITSTNIVTGECVNNVLTIFGQPTPITNTVISASAITTVYNGGKYLVATLKDINGKPIVGVQVTINLNGVKYLTTDNNGQVKLSTNGLAPNIYTALISFEGNDEYVGSSATALVTITSPQTPAAPDAPTETVKLTLKKVTVKKSSKKLVISATLKINGKKVKGKTVTFKFNGKIYKAKTNKNGIAKLTIKKNVLKKLKVGKKVKYQASYGKVTVTKTVKVKK